MAALTADKPVPRKSKPEPIDAGRIYIEEATQIFAGSLIMANPADADFFVPAADTATATPSPVVLFCPENINNLAGADGDKFTDRAQSQGVYLLDIDEAVTQADVGKVVYATDDQTVHHTFAAGDTPVGRITEIQPGYANKVWVFLGGPFTDPAAAA